MRLLLGVESALSWLFCVFSGDFARCLMSLKDMFVALCVVIIWGVNFVVIKVGLSDMPPFLLAGLRFLLVAVPAIFL